MKKWIVKQMGPVGILITCLIGLFPEAFASFGKTLKMAVPKWLVNNNYYILIGSYPKSIAEATKT